MGEIKHQKQGDLDCVCTCIAMITGIKRRTITRRYQHRYMNESGFDTNNILDDLGVKYRKCIHGDRIDLNKVYLVTVPSLNMAGLFHQIIIDTRAGFEILDPNRGVSGRNYYVLRASPSARKQIKLRAWILDYEIYM
ncbi:hypothetical protein ACEVVA_002080 [Salmonella enterica]|nr:hypothetical protein [Salmonella enterica]EDJ5487132.1 hypothetical protein [Salmonella enterica]EDJ5493142.1 hypothetical protein [Salmonella enterica]EEA7994178.1 hypothetical protein [Salmonella enterica subsp. enterica]EIL5405415.1 hypothetical protein [Salmonella enterica]